jgi:2-polyprenyl-3-methyl-5-hydroxy-6-metoxy-1,4-benzoquinol methylase
LESDVTALVNVLCNLCGEDQPRELAVINSTRIVKCRRCGLGYVNPRESSEVLARIDEEYYGEGQLLEEASHFNVGGAPFFRHILRLIARQHKSGTVLDIGSGGGFFLKMARDHGYTCYGVEVDEDGCKVARRHGGLNIFHGTLHGAEFADGFFDAVTILNCLEHIENPAELLKEVKRILKPGGTLVVSVPNLIFGMGLLKFYKVVSLVGVPDFRNTFGVFCVPEHHYFFAPSTLMAMMKKVGFEDTRVMNAAPINNPGYRLWTACKYLSYWASSLVTFATGGALIPNYTMTVTARRP